VTGVDDRRTRFEIRLPGDLLDALHIAARVRRVSASEAARDAIRAYIAATVDAATSEAAPAPGRPQNPSSIDHDPTAAERQEVYETS
jgi:hypothetical protein